MEIPLSCTEKIQSALQQKRKSIAMSYLRSKKQLEDLLTKRLGSLEILQSTLMRVEGAAGDVEVCGLSLIRKYFVDHRSSQIMKSYESSTVTLRTILAHPSLQRDKIDETMDAMASASADARDVDEAIKIGGDVAAADAGIDESELEEELQALAKESEKETEDEAQREKRARLAEERMNVPEQTPDAVDFQEPSKNVPEQRPAVHDT
jgi:charged multivesicular body protein 7